MDMVVADEVPVREVPCMPGGRLHISWGAGHCLHLIDCVGTEQPAGEPAKACDDITVTATCLRWYRPSATMRKVGYDVQPLFEKLQEQHYSGRVAPQSAEWVAEVKRYSRAVSTAMGRTDGIREPPEQVTGEVLQGGSVDVDDVVVAWQRGVWELLEVFFVEKGSTRDIITEDLAQWLRRNWAVMGLVGDDLHVGSNPWAELRAEALEGEASFEGLESHPLYWPCLLRAVALGWAGMTEDLLSWHSAWRRAAVGDTRTDGWREQIEALEVVQTILRSLPHFCREGTPDVTGRAFHALPEFLQYRDAWVRECQSLLRGEEHLEMWDACAAAAPATANGLRSLLQVLSGDEDELKGCTASWLELFVAEVLHCYPHLKPQVEFAPLLQRCVELAPSPPSDPWGVHLRALMEAAADFDAQTVMAELQAGPATTPWLLAHVPDILGTGSPAVREMLNRPLPAYDCSQVEHYRLDYAMSLMPYRATWRLATQYLAWCPSHGAAALKLLLDRLPIAVPGGDTQLAQKALSVCRHHGGPIAGVGASLCRTLGALAWREGRVGAALYWLLEGHDGARAGAAVKELVQAVEAALQNASSEVAEVRGLSEVAALLEGQGTELSAASAQRSLHLDPQGRASLELLLRYHQLRSALCGAAAAEGRTALDGTSPSLRAAREALLGLLKPGVARRALWPAIVFKAVPLLEATQPPMFSYADTQLLQQRLAEVRLAGAASETLQMQTVRLALLRHMTRAHIVECSAGV